MPPFIRSEKGKLLTDHAVGAAYGGRNAVSDQQKRYVGRERELCGTQIARGHHRFRLLCRGCMVGAPDRLRVGACVMCVSFCHLNYCTGVAYLCLPSQ